MSSASSVRRISAAATGSRNSACAGRPASARTDTSFASVRTISPSSRSNGLFAMPCATSQVSTTLIGHNSSSGASIQSRISPNSERCSRKAVSAGGGFEVRRCNLCGDLLEAVAEAAHGGDPHRALLDLLAQPVHVDLDRVVADLFAPFAQALDQLVLADESAGALQQHFEQAQLS